MSACLPHDLDAASSPESVNSVSLLVEQSSYRSLLQNSSVSQICSFITQSSPDYITAPTRGGSLYFCCTLKHCFWVFLALSAFIYVIMWKLLMGMIPSAWEFPFTVLFPSKDVFLSWESGIVPTYHYVEGRESAESKQVDRREQKELRDQNWKRDEKQWAIRGPQRKEGWKEAVIAFYLLVWKRFYSAAAGSLCFLEVKQEPPTMDLWFLAFSCSLWWTVSGRRSLYYHE